MNRGKKFEQKVGNLFEDLRRRYPEQVEVDPQFLVTLASGRQVLIDFRIAVDFAHERQAYYFELQSRERHSHELSDKVEAIRRDTRLSTFSFVHEAPLSATVASELKARNIITYDWSGLVRFTEGVELQLLQLASAKLTARGLAPQDLVSRNRLIELVKKLAESQSESRELRPPPSAPRNGLVDEIVKEVAKDPAEAIRLARRFLRF